MQNTAADPVMLELFRTELETHTRTLDEGLIKAEAEQSPATLEPLMRAAHSIKGAARMMGLDRAVRLAHAMEDVLAAAQRGTLRLTSAHIEVLLRSNDVFLRAAAAAPADIPSELEKQREVIDHLITELAKPGPPQVPPEVEPPSLAPPKPAASVVAASPAPSAGVDTSMLEMFRSELETHTRTLTEELGKPDTAWSSDRLDRLSRAAHSVKGAARMVGLSRAVQLATAMEDALVSARRGPGTLTAAQIELLSQCTGALLRAAASPPATVAAVFEQQSDAIEQLIARLAAPPAAGPSPVKIAASKEPPAAAEDQSVRVRAESLNRLVGLAGECVVQASLTRPLIAGLQRIKQEQSIAAAGAECTRDLLREGKIAEASEELERSVGAFRQACDLVPRQLAEMDDWSRHLDVLVSSLYGEAIASRMRPFADGTHGYSRMVHDLAKNLGKQVHFEIDGSSTPVDRDILERMESPLTHLLRNALDHGVELPADRAARGKPTEGKVVLSARHISGMLRIAVTDDGGGVNLAEVRRKITEADYLSEEIARNLGEAETMEFLFLPGFSTARVVTEVSGRGVGLDVVHSAVRAVGGSVRVQSKPGAGTTVELELPLTLAIVRSLLVEIGAEVYGLPLTRIDRLVRTTLKEVDVLEDRQFCVVDGKDVGVLDARQVLGSSGSSPAKNLCLAIISDRLNRYGLAVDRFIGQRDLVVKPLPACLGKVPNVSAGTILNDGTPALILDADDLVRSMDKLLGQGVLRKVAAPPESAAPRARRRVLVVDDSITVREVERRLLENKGYEVTVAVDGMDGWNALQRASFDLLVTDIDMPRMDGLELVRRVRAAPGIAALPIVIVSYKEQPEYRLQGMEAGANYYLTKSSFQDESLAGAVRDLIGEA